MNALRGSMGRCCRRWYSTCIMGGCRPWLLVSAICLHATVLLGQEYGVADRQEPGDAMIQQYLAREARELDSRFLADVPSLDVWQSQAAERKEQYLHMLGLWPLPEKTPLQATVTRSMEGDGYTVDMLHYQSRPQLYVTGNLYRPAAVEAGQRLPAVFYVCGHSNQGRSGNKTAYQSHGIWFARHGYICLVVDTLQLGEIAAIHHGTYRENRWWWHSRGYTPAGVECWNGIRGIDYLISRPDVDAQRIAVTGISGGGAATFWIAAADERVAAAVPVSGMADLESYVGNRVINGHCDCMFLYNTFRWPWTQIAGLVAPRPMLFANSDQDAIFPMDANDRVICRLERLYSLYGKGDFVDALVSIGGHAYRQDIRQGAYRFINSWLKDDPRSVADSEVDIPTGERGRRQYAIPAEQLQVFATDADLPKDEQNTTIDEHFVALGQPPIPGRGQFDGWKAGLQSELRRVTFGYFPQRIPAGKPRENQIGDVGEEGRDVPLETEPGITVPLWHSPTLPPGEVKELLLVVRGAEDQATAAELAAQVRQPGQQVYVLEPRGIGATRWTQKNPPNYVARSHVLLGRTVDTGRVWDIAAAARYIHERQQGGPAVKVWCQGPTAVLAACAALWEPEIAELTLLRPPLTWQDSAAPPLLNVLRVCDVPDVFGMLAPRPLTIEGVGSDELQRACDAYEAAGAADEIVLVP